MYKQKLVPIKNSIIKLLLPIKITPYFTSIVSHLFFDGSVPEEEKGTYYNQKEKEIIELFIKKLKKVFGEVNYSLVKDHREVLKLRIPRIIGEICKEIYEIKTFNGNKAEISKFILSLNKDHKSAFIISAILDGGAIGYDGHILFGVSNKKLCEQVRNLCIELKLNVSPINFREKSNNHYYFRILSKEKFLETVQDIEKKFPLISLNYKKKRLESYFKTLENPGLRTKKGGDERKEKLKNLLSKKEYSVNELCTKLLIPPRTIRRHLYNLMDKKLVKRRRFGKDYLYTSLTPH